MGGLTTLWPVLALGRQTPAGDIWDGLLLGARARVPAAAWRSRYQGVSRSWIPTWCLLPLVLVMCFLHMCVSYRCLDLSALPAPHLCIASDVHDGLEGAAGKPRDQTRLGPACRWGTARACERM